MTELMRDVAEAMRLLRDVPVAPAIRAGSERVVTDFATAAGIEMRKAEAAWNGAPQMFGVPIRIDLRLPENSFLIGELMYVHRDGNWYRMDLSGMPNFGAF